jgi:hypothetical protein
MQHSKAVEVPSEVETRQQPGDLKFARRTSFSIRLCSRVSGRERWRVGALKGRPRLAAAVELILRGQQGVTAATTNPLTGSVLVYYSPDLLTESIEVLIQRALQFGPMTTDEFVAFTANVSKASFTKHLFAAEVGCFLVKMFFLGGCCPAGAAATGLLALAWR